MVKMVKLLVAVLLVLNMANGNVALGCEDDEDAVTVSCKVTDGGVTGDWTPGTSARCTSEIVPTPKPHTVWTCSCASKTYTRSCESSSGSRVEGCSAEGSNTCSGDTTTSCPATGGPIKYEGTKPKPEQVTADCSAKITACDPAACPATGGPEVYCCPHPSSCSASTATGTVSYFVAKDAKCATVPVSTTTDAATLMRSTDVLGAKKLSTKLNQKPKAAPPVYYK